MNARLTVTGFLAALACMAALAGAARAEDGDGMPSEEIVTTLPAETGDPGIDDTWAGVVVEDPGAGEGEGGTPAEHPEDGGDPVAYGPDDCIDCSFAPTAEFTGESHGGAGNQRAAAAGGGAAMGRDSGGSGRPACGTLRPHDMRPCDK